MIVEITENMEFNGVQYLRTQQYAYVGSRIMYQAPPSISGPNVYPTQLCTSCTDKKDYKSIVVYDIIVGDQTLYIPYDMAAILNKEEPSTDMSGAVEKWEKKRCKDILAPMTGGHTDVVFQAKEFRGVDIRQHRNNVQVNGERVRELKELGYDGLRHPPEDGG